MEKDALMMFKTCGEIECIDLFFNPMTGKLAGRIWVIFREMSSVSNALRLDCTTVRDPIIRRLDILKVGITFVQVDNVPEKQMNATRFIVDGEKLTMLTEINSDEEAHAEEARETRLAMDHDLYDCGQDDY
jgi:hypothetical protein